MTSCKSRALTQPHNLQLGAGDIGPRLAESEAATRYEQLSRTFVIQLSECIRGGYIILESGSPEAILALDRAGGVQWLEQAPPLLGAILGRLVDLSDDQTAFPAYIRRIATNTE